VSDESTDVDAAREALDDARRRLADVPAEVVVTNHVMGLYELAAIHLSTEPPDLASSQLAIDSVRALVDSLGERLGSEIDVLRAALANIQMAFVEVKRRTEVFAHEEGPDSTHDEAAVADEHPAPTDNGPSAPDPGGEPPPDGSPTS
jgi:hypothetical protein